MIATVIAVIAVAALGCLAVYFEHPFGEDKQEDKKDDLFGRRLVC